MSLHASLDSVSTDSEAMWAWVRAGRPGKGAVALCVRLTHLDESFARELVAEYNGAATFWRQGSWWQWEGQGKTAEAFLFATRHIFRLALVPAEAKL